MDSTYTPPNCGPSRTALFSGTHAYRFGLQGHGMSLGGSGHVPLSRTILPQKLKQLGYKTHLIGKWHQGFCNWAMYPTNRGFDSFYGFLAQGQDHFKHIKREEGHLPPYPYDFRFNEMPDFTVAGEYSVDIYSERARTIIREHIEEFPDNRTPFFILLSHAAIHVPNQVPQCYVNTYCQAAYPNPERRTKCGMMAAVDEGLTNIVDDLERAGILNNTLIVFTSDNGGAQNAGSSNWPLRGGKGTLWEGGIRIPSFIYSKSRTILPHTRWTWNGLFYMTDWYGTLWGFATQRGDRQLPETPDGYNMWRKLYSGSGTSFRTEFAFINEVQNHSYIRHGDWKLLIGQNSERRDLRPDKFITLTLCTDPKSASRDLRRDKFITHTLCTDPIDSRVQSLFGGA
nr:hypothetical protein BaRGS_016220 [Batillaria attramentaria]